MTYTTKEVPKTPTTDMLTSATPEFKKQIIEQKFKEIMEVLGLDLTDDSLAETPRRVAKMYVDEIFCGLLPNNLPKMTTVDNKFDSQMVTVGDITVNSTCEHHFVTISGFAHIAYIPGKKVLGLSKFNRLVDYYARRPQIQERLTEQVQKHLCNILETDNVAVVIDAIHFCVKSRGVKDANSLTRTTALGGVFKDNDNTRAEFFKNVPAMSDFKL